MLISLHVVLLLITEHEIVVSYFELVANEINNNKDDGDIHKVLRPVLDSIHQQLKNLSLSRSDLLPFADIVLFFTRTSCLAEVCFHLDFHSDSELIDSDMLCNLCCCFGEATFINLWAVGVRDGWIKFANWSPYKQGSKSAGRYSRLNMAL